MHVALLARAHAWWVFAACGLGLVATRHVASPDRVRPLLALVVGLLAVLAIHAGARWHRTDAPRPWRLMSCGLLIAALGSPLVDAMERFGHRSSRDSTASRTSTSRRSATSAAWPPTPSSAWACSRSSAHVTPGRTGRGCSTASRSRPASRWSPR